MQQRESQRRHQREGRRLPIYPNPGMVNPNLLRAMYRSLLADKKHLRFIRRSPKPLRLNKQRNTSTFRSGDISLPILAAEFVLSRRIPVPVCRLCPASGFCWQLPGADGLLQ